MAEAFFFLSEISIFLDDFFFWGGEMGNGSSKEKGVVFGCRKLGGCTTCSLDWSLGSEKMLQL